MKTWQLLLAALALLLPQSAQAWWQNDWSYRKSITVDTSPSGINVSEPLGRTVVLVRLHTGNFTFADALENGADLRVVDSDDKTPLPFHIELYDPQTGIATLWVSLPTLNGGEKKQLWLYFGNKNAPVGQDVPGTFDPDHMAVYHFETAAGTPLKDSSANGNNGANGPSAVNDGAVIGRGGRFVGQGGVTVPPSASLALPAGSPFTLSTWVKPGAPAGEQAIVASGPLLVGLRQGLPFVAVGGASFAAPAPLQPNQWSHLAVVSDGAAFRLYVNGIEAGSASAAMPALDGGFQIGGAEGRPFTGELDELRLSRTARPATQMMAMAQSEGATSKLVGVSETAEEQGGHGGVMLFIIKATPLLDWVVIAMCMVLLGFAIAVMWAKSSYVGKSRKANAVFMKRFREMRGHFVPIAELPGVTDQEVRFLDHSPLYHLYKTGLSEIDERVKLYDGRPLSSESVDAVRASVDAEVVAENQKLDKWMVILTIAISGGPFIGLLGTVMGVMNTFGGVAMAGDVNVTAIAPGIAAALLATIAGLACAIPSLFGYNYLNGQISTLADEMRVFVDRVVTRMAEAVASGAHNDNPPASTPIAAE